MGTRTTGLLFTILTALALSACASGPGFDTEGVNRDLQPRQAASERIQDALVIWGGTIISVRPQEDSTQLEVLAYPLDRSEQPRTDRSSQGRFLIMADGYLEPADYSEGRQVTVRGRLLESRTATIGEAEYRYAVVSANNVHLWPRQVTTQRQEPRVNFGIGIGIIR